ncbi:MAG TPA: hypothetical protein VGW98_04855 [Solirubrobacteraceae bacterium]|nr:hypothetical protein [Solirubrobacteraceae bacterium]
MLDGVSRAALDQRLVAFGSTLRVLAGEDLEAAAKSMEGEQLAAFEEACRETYDRMARISIVPDWARYFDFGAGRFPGFLRELTSKD